MWWMARMKSKWRWPAAARSKKEPKWWERTQLHEDVAVLKISGK